jgi:methylated-DNA-[protein]-cysteine S-methyltransferase
MTTGFSLFDTAIGHCGIAWSIDGIRGVQLPEMQGLQQTRTRLANLFPQATEQTPPTQVQDAIFRITSLLSGQLDDLREVALDMSQVPYFSQRVYQITRDILPGQTLTYGEVAMKLGQPRAARAVGHALGRNPFAPVVPCHRVLAAGRRSGGFSASGGVGTKLRLLQIEGAMIGTERGLFDD